MTQAVDYAKFSANAYAATLSGPSPNVSEENTIPISSGWKQIDNKVNNATGFLARAYQRD